MTGLAEGCVRRAANDLRDRQPYSSATKNCVIWHRHLILAPRDWPATTPDRRGGVAGSLSCHDLSGVQSLFSGIFSGRRERLPGDGVLRGREGAGRQREGRAEAAALAVGARDVVRLDELDLLAPLAARLVERPGARRAAV